MFFALYGDAPACGLRWDRSGTTVVTFVSNAHPVFPLGLVGDCLLLNHRYWMIFKRFGGMAGAGVAAFMPCDALLNHDVVVFSPLTFARSPAV